MADPDGKFIFEVSVERRLNAAHALRFADGTQEPLHGHDWRIRATFAADQLDEFGLVVDFHRVEAAMEEILAPFTHHNLSSIKELSRLNPSAEALAWWVLVELEKQGFTEVMAVEVEESPGCRATCRRKPTAR